MTAKLPRIPKKTGPPSLLTEELVQQIGVYAMEGADLPEIAEKIGIKIETLRNWRYENRLQLADKLVRWESLHMLALAEEFSKKLMRMEESPEGLTNERILAIKQKESEFLRDKLLVAKHKYGVKDIINVQINLPQPIIDLGKVVDEQ